MTEELDQNICDSTHRTKLINIYIIYFYVIMSHQYYPIWSIPIPFNIYSMSFSIPIPIPGSIYKLCIKTIICCSICMSDFYTSGSVNMPNI